MQYSQTNTISWNGMATGRHLLPYVRESDVRYNSHLYTQYISDAHGLQLITDAHLERANDLSDWIVEPLAGERHLLQARDLERWHAHPDPDPAVLAEARADLGPIILTPQIITSNPLPEAPEDRYPES